MVALLFALGIIGLCVVLLAVVTRHMVNTIMNMYNDILDRSLYNYGIDKVTKKHKEDTNDSDRT